MIKWVKKMWTSNNKKYLIILTIFLIIGFIFGLFFLNNVDEASKEIILNNINEWVINLDNIHINYIISHLLVLSLFIILSIFLIGIPLYIFYIFYNGFSLGFIISSLSNIFGAKGLLYSIVYILITKVIPIILIIILFMFLIRIGENIIWNLFNKKNGTKRLINRLIKKSIIVLFIIIINDIILYLWGGKILNIFHFLII